MASKWFDRSLGACTELVFPLFAVLFITPGVKASRYSSGDSMEDFLIPFIITVAILATLITLVAIFLCRRQPCTCCGIQCMCISCDCNQKSELNSVSKNKSITMLTSDRIACDTQTYHEKNGCLVDNMEHETPEVIGHKDDKCRRCQCRELTGTDNIINIDKTDNPDNV